MNNVRNIETRMKVGDTVYYFDTNYREYVDEKGNKTSALGALKKSLKIPVYKKHFRPVEITGEDNRKFLIKQDEFFEGYINKATGKLWFGREGWQVYTESEKQDNIWLNDKKHKVVDAVQFCNDVEKIRQIAHIVGFPNEY